MKFSIDKEKKTIKMSNGIIFRQLNVSLFQHFWSFFRHFIPTNHFIPTEKINPLRQVPERIDGLKGNVFFGKRYYLIEPSCVEVFDEQSVNLVI